jgi:uncharacterized membrane protein (UPF0136 family)
MTQAGEIVLGIYAFLLATSGLIGYVKRGSWLALGGGLLAAAVAFAALHLSVTKNRWALPLAFFLSFVVVMVCSSRLRRERKQVRLRDEEGKILGKSMQTELLFIASGLVLCVLGASRTVGPTRNVIFASCVFGILALMFVVKWIRA